MKKNYLKPDFYSLTLETDVVLASTPLDQDDFYGANVFGGGNW